MVHVSAWWCHKQKIVVVEIPFSSIFIREKREKWANAVTTKPYMLFYCCSVLTEMKIENDLSSAVDKLEGTSAVS